MKKIKDSSVKNYIEIITLLHFRECGCVVKKNEQKLTVETVRGGGKEIELEGRLF